MIAPKIMVVEDEEPLGVLLKYNLEAEGYQVEVITRGDEAEVRLQENVPDLRNTRVIDIVRELKEYGVSPLVHDPHVESAEAEAEYGLRLAPLEALRDLDALILAVPHAAYKGLTPATLQSWFNGKGRGVLLDVKGFFNPAETGDLLFWRL